MIIRTSVLYDAKLGFAYSERAQLFTMIRGEDECS